MKLRLTILLVILCLLPVAFASNWDFASNGASIWNDQDASSITSVTNNRLEVTYSSGTDYGHFLTTTNASFNISNAFNATAKVTVQSAEGGGPISCFARWSNGSNDISNATSVQGGNGNTCYNSLNNSQGVSFMTESIGRMYLNAWIEGVLNQCQLHTGIARPYTNYYRYIYFPENKTIRGFYDNDADFSSITGSCSFSLATQWSRNTTFSYFSAFERSTATGIDSFTLYIDDLDWSYNTPITVPTISSANCTSCGTTGDTTSPYTTSDTTPTFTFSTDINANCRVARTAQSYSSMGSTRNCSSGDGSTAHTCTIGVADELIHPFDTVYATCISTIDSNLQGNASFQMEITNLAENQSQAIVDGIHASSIWPGASILANQQVVLVNSTNYQLVRTVDYTATYGNQMWVFNYENTSSIGLFNVSPAVYILDMVNISLTEIKNRVEALINTTKQ